MRPKLLSQAVPRNEDTAGSEDAKVRFPQTAYGLNLEDLGLHQEGIHRNFQKIISAKGHRHIWEAHKDKHKAARAANWKTHSINQPRKTSRGLQ